MRPEPSAPILIALFVLLLGSAISQEPAVPSELLNKQSSLAGDSVTFCYDGRAVDAAFNRAVGQAIADELLLEASFHPVTAEYPIDADAFFDDIFIALTNECDAALGFAMIPGAYPDWLTITRPYAVTTFVLAVTDPAINSFADIKLPGPVGAHVTSHGDARLLNHLLQLPPRSRWQRIPYGTNDLLLERLLDGTLAAIVIYEPELYRLLQGNYSASGVRVIPAAPLRDLQVRLGAVLHSNNSYLQHQIDVAIDSLIESGRINDILQETGTPGTPSD